MANKGGALFSSQAVHSHLKTPSDENELLATLPQSGMAEVAENSTGATATRLARPCGQKFMADRRGDGRAMWIRLPKTDRSAGKGDKAQSTPRSHEGPQLTPRSEGSRRATPRRKEEAEPRCPQRTGSGRLPATAAWEKEWLEEGADGVTPRGGNGQHLTGNITRTALTDGRVTEERRVPSYRESELRLQHRLGSDPWRATRVIHGSRPRESINARRGPFFQNHLRRPS